MQPPTDANVNVDQPSFTNPIVEGKPWVFGTAWQNILAILVKAIRVIDGGTP